MLTPTEFVPTPAGLLAGAPPEGRVVVVEVVPLLGIVVVEEVVPVAGTVVVVVVEGKTVVLVG